MRRLGHDESGLLVQAGIPPELLSKPFARVSSQRYGQLWLMIGQAMDDEFFCMNVRRMKLATFAYISRAAVKEPTVGAALEVLLRLFSLVFDDFSPQLVCHGGLAEITLTEAPGRQYRCVQLFHPWLLVRGLLCWLAGRRIPVLAIEPRCAAPEFIEDYQMMFSINLRFLRPYSRLLFNAEALQVLVRRSAPDLKRFLAGLPENILVRYRDPQSLAANIAAPCASAQRSRPSITIICEALMC